MENVNMTTKNETTRRMRYLGRKARRGEATESEIRELANLENGFYTQSGPCETIYDLPIAERMWKADAREIEGRHGPRHKDPSR